MKYKPQPGDRVAVYDIPGVQWPEQESEHPVRGIVTDVKADNHFRFLPDEPDPTSNGGGNARKFDSNLGWHVDPDNRWEPDVFVIQEELLP